MRHSSSLIGYGLVHAIATVLLSTAVSTASYAEDSPAKDNGLSSTSPQPSLQCPFDLGGLFSKLKPTCVDLLSNAQRYGQPSQAKDPLPGQGDSDGHKAASDERIMRKETKSSAERNIEEPCADEGMDGSVCPFEHDCPAQSDEELQSTASACEPDSHIPDVSSDNSVHADATKPESHEAAQDNDDQCEPCEMGPCEQESSGDAYDTEVASPPSMSETDPVSYGPQVPCGCIGPVVEPCWLHGTAPTLDWLDYAAFLKAGSPSGNQESSELTRAAP